MWGPLLTGAPRDIANWSDSRRHPLLWFMKRSAVTLAHSPNGDPGDLLRSASLSSLGISMAKQRFASWLAAPRAWLAALMSSLRFDDVANKRTLLIIWPPTSSVKTTLPPLPLHASSSLSMSFSSDDLKMRSRLHEHKQGQRSSRAPRPWNYLVQDVPSAGEPQSQMTEGTWNFGISQYWWYIYISI